MLLLPKPPQQYDQTDQAVCRRSTEAEDKKNIKQGNVFDKILMRDTVTGAVVTVTVASGALVIT